MQSTSPGIAVVGSGAWGTTLALIADRAGTPTTLLVRSDADRKCMAEERRHPRSLEGVQIPESIAVSSDTEKSLAEASIVILAIPTQRLRSGLESLAAMLAGKIVVSAAKGIEVGTSMLPTQILADVIGEHSGQMVCALSGPNLATEIAKGKPTTTVVASNNMDAATSVQRAMMGSTFRVYTSPDLTGVQIGGALKNIVAIGAGIGDGLNAGDNAKAAFMTRGIAEIARLGVGLGADPLTFAGLSGIGDLICTCSSDLSRNHRVGVRLAAGEALGSIVASMGEVAEGVDTTRATVKMARDMGVEMPIAEEMHRVMFEDKSPLDAVLSLMKREPRHEHL